jgi:hypothetical protein
MMKIDNNDKDLYSKKDWCLCVCTYVLKSHLQFDNASLTTAHFGLGRRERDDHEYFIRIYLLNHLNHTTFISKKGNTLAKTLVGLASKKRSKL